MNNSLKSVVFDIMDKQGGLIRDQEVVNELAKRGGNIDFNFSTMENYKQQWRKKFLLSKKISSTITGTKLWIHINYKPPQSHGKLTHSHQRGKGRVCMRDILNIILIMFTGVIIGFVIGGEITLNKMDKALKELNEIHQ